MQWRAKKSNMGRIEPHQSQPSRSNIVNIAQYKNRDIITLCEAIIAKAERGGEIRGLLFAVQDKNGEVNIGTTGEYLTSPHELLHVASEVFAYYAGMFAPIESDT